MNKNDDIDEIDTNDKNCTKRKNHQKNNFAHKKTIAFLNA